MSQATLLWINLAVQLVNMAFILHWFSKLYRVAKDTERKVEEMTLVDFQKMLDVVQSEYVESDEEVNRMADELGRVEKELKLAIKKRDSLLAVATNLQRVIESNQ